MKSTPTYSSLKFLKSIKTALISESEAIEKKLAPKKKLTLEKNATPTKKKNLAVYKAPDYPGRPEPGPRKEYIIKLDKDIDWGEDIWGFNPKFIYETPTDPYEADDEDDMIYGVSRDFYDELIEVLSTNVEEIWNEPEILSIEEI